ncbi:MAG: ABC transporter substrate-binding protein [Lautropia sp.]
MLTLFAVLMLAAAVLAPRIGLAVTLRWAAQGDVVTLDPHAQNHTPTIAVLQHAYEGLTRYDRDYRVEPALATAWTMNSPTEWRFQLRRGVRFHDGTPFNADDVVFSFERLKESGNSMSSVLSGVKDIRRIDEFTVEFMLERPLPLLLRNMVDFRIVSRSWAQKNKSEKAQDLKNREDTFASKNANGTGAFIIRSWTPELRIVLEKNPNWWDKAPGNIDEILFTPIRQDSARLAALTNDDVDLVTDVPAQEVPRLRRLPALTVLDGPEPRTVFIGMDQSSEELRYSTMRGRNPFKDIRVRRALSLATDPDAIRRTVMHGLSVPAAILVAPGVNGWTAELDRRAAPDIREARLLLHEAGYPDGFDVTLDCPNNRYVNDDEICRALAGQWARVGIRVNVNSMPFSSFIPKLEKLDSSLWFLGWGATGYDALQTLQALVRTRSNGPDGSFNIGRISNPAIDALIDAAKTETDPGKRDAVLRDALQLTAQNYYYLPIHHQVRSWAMRRNVTTVYKSDERPESRFVVKQP